MGSSHIWSQAVPYNSTGREKKEPQNLEPKNKVNRIAEGINSCSNIA